MLVITQGGYEFETKYLSDVARRLMPLSSAGKVIINVCISEDNEISLQTENGDVLLVCGTYCDYEEAEDVAQSFLAYKRMIRPKYIFPACGQIRKWENGEVYD